jgi:hypothetical protein
VSAVVVVLSFALPVAILAAGVWALRRHARLYPPGTRLGDRNEPRRRDLKWYGFVYGGGRG